MKLNRHKLGFLAMFQKINLVRVNPKMVATNRPKMMKGEIRKATENVKLGEVGAEQTKKIEPSQT